MEHEETIRLLAAIRALCQERGEIDGAVLARALDLSPTQAQGALDHLEAEGLIAVNEYGFSCSVETMVEGLTPRGQALLDG